MLIFVLSAACRVVVLAALVLLLVLSGPYLGDVVGAGVGRLVQLLGACALGELGGLWAFRLYRWLSRVDPAT